MKKLIVLAAFLTFPALAQQPSPAAIQGVVAEIEAQRQIAQTRAAKIAGELAEAQAEIERLKKLCGKPCEAEKK